MVDLAGRSWTDSEERVEASQSARSALELITREMAPATIDTCEQYVVLKGVRLTLPVEHPFDPYAVKTAQAAFWMAPLGKDGDLRAIGYYLQRNEDKGYFRLKRFYVGPDNEDYFPRGFDAENVDDTSILSEETSAARFLSRLDPSVFDDSDPENKNCLVSTVAEGVIAMWMQCYDILGNPIPWASESDKHPECSLIFNSASLFVMATSTPFDDGNTFNYLPATTGIKGNRLPAAVGITLITLDSVNLDRFAGKVPVMENVISDNGALDVDASLELYQQTLRDLGIDKARTFTTRVKLTTGS
jgi:hypothetical protein